MSSLIRAHDLQFQSSEGAQLLHRASFDVFCGERIVLMGPSGGGKSLLLRGLVLLNAGQEGDIYYRGDRVSANVPAFRSQCMYVPQKIRFRGESVAELLRRPFELSVHADKQFDGSRIIGWLARLERDESFLNASPASLSGGELQIVVLLRALQLDPVALLLDEPTAALDPKMTLAVEELLLSWQAEREDERAMVWVSHNEEQAQRIATARWTMQTGRLIQGGEV